MLEIRNADKFFNKGKKNEIHVIHNTSITLEDHGLVALLGPSGCGKTTLLNTIGGLDKLRSGSIYINGEKINSRFAYKVDKIRNLNVGYIFQDYKLIENLSVYENVAIVLKMIGIKDKEEIDKRVCYVLDKVGMLRYKKRPAAMLSGGERQRVGIARAIVKDPNIILADEPTGNLDSKNSLEIMKIIRSISKDRLVILVTHEQNLAKFYATRIIEIQDGQVVSDYPNEHTSELDYRLDNTFYLKDFEHQDKIGNNSCDLHIYSNSKEKIKLDVVVTNGNIYIKSNTRDKIEVIDENSNIELVNDHYKKIAREDIDRYKFDFGNIINKDIKKKYSSILNPIRLIVGGFRRVFDYSFLKKMLLIGFFLSGIFLMYAVSSIQATLTLRDEDFVEINKEYLMVNQKQISVDDYLAYEDLSSVDYLLPGDSLVTFHVAYKDFYQTSTQSDELVGSLSDIRMINEDDLIYGKMPVDEHEIVVDQFAIENMFKSNVAKMSGVVLVSDMIGRTVTIPNMQEFTIVGIVDKGSPSIYTNSSLFVNIIANSTSMENNLIDYTLYQDQLELKKGSWPVNDYEVIVNISNEDAMKLGSEINVEVGGRKLKVVGYYDSKYNYTNYFVNNQTILYHTIDSTSSFVIKSQDKASTLSYFKDRKINIEDSYESSKSNYQSQVRERNRNSLLVSGVILVISLIEIFLMVRSSFLSRVKEVGIYRAIGVKKIDIYKMFFGEIFAITTLASVPGILLMAYILKTLSSISYLSSFFVINIFVVLITILFVYLFNLLVGLLPVFNTIRKTPAQILSRYDLD